MKQRINPNAAATTLGHQGQKDRYLEDIIPEPAFSLKNDIEILSITP